MKRNLLLFFAIILILGIVLTIAYFIPLPLTPALDFQVLYNADQGILHGVPLYDRAGQAKMLAQQAGVPADKVFVLPFPYPPWYALITLPLAMLPATVAARLWFLLNIGMLLLSVWLLTDGWTSRKRLFSFILAPMFLPIFGALFVGQYVFPTILGMALSIYALKQERIWLTAVGMALITFKPHVGLLVLLTVSIYLLFRRDEFGRRAFWAVLITGFLLFVVGFLADKAWPITYLQSLLGFKDVSRCNLCVSLPMTISSLLGWGFDQALPIAGVLLLVLGGLFIGNKQSGRKEANWIVAAPICIALLVNPYLQNYDFAFLIVPLFVLAGSTEVPLHWVLLMLVYLMPWISVGLFERDGNGVLLIIAVIICFSIYRLDAHIGAAYNTNN